MRLKKVCFQGRGKVVSVSQLLKSLKKMSEVKFTVMQTSVVSESFEKLVSGKDLDLPEKSDCSLISNVDSSLLA